jgi:hypothetical protein
MRVFIASLSEIIKQMIVIQNLPVDPRICCDKIVLDFTGGDTVQTCSKCQTQSPDSAKLCTGCQADLSEWSTSAVALNQYRENPRVKHVYIIVSDDCCPACRKFEGYYNLDEVPALPLEGCSSPNGCRCFYQPYLTDIYP